MASSWPERAANIDASNSRHAVYVPYRTAYASSGTTILSAWGSAIFRPILYFLFGSRSGLSAVVLSLAYCSSLAYHPMGLPVSAAAPAMDVLMAWARIGIGLQTCDACRYCSRFTTILRSAWIPDWAIFYHETSTCVWTSRTDCTHGCGGGLARFLVFGLRCCGVGLLSLRTWSMHSLILS